MQLFLQKSEGYLRCENVTMRMVYNLHGGRRLFSERMVPSYEGNSGNMIDCSYNVTLSKEYKNFITEIAFQPIIGTPIKGVGIFDSNPIANLVVSATSNLEQH